MSCPLHSNDNSCAGCAKVKVEDLERQLAEAKEAMCIYVREHANNEEIETDEQAVTCFKNMFNEKNYN